MYNTTFALKGVRRFLGISLALLIYRSDPFLCYNIPMLKINTNILLAPMSGCTDLAFRLIAREHGARFCFFEMLDSNCVVRGRRQTFSILKTRADDSPIAGQLLGSDPHMMLDAANKILEYADMPFLDINCACPAKKVIKKKAGAHLLRDTERLYKILKLLTGSLKIPITMKIRIGYDTRDRRHIVDLVKNAEALGVSAIFVHGRLAAQGYAGDIDYESIRAIKEAVKIPVFGSGNVFSPEAAKRMLDETSCDGVLVGRGALGNPWIFNKIERFLKTGEIAGHVDIGEKIAVLKRHLEYFDKLSGLMPTTKVGVMKKISIWYLKYLPKAARLREKITAAKTYEALLGVIDRTIMPGRA